MAKKKEHHEEHADETWLLPYSDLLTLLLALFIVMFAMSNVDKEKYEKLSQQFNIVFSDGSGVMEKDGSSIIPMQQPVMPVTAPAVSNPAMEEDTMVQIKRSIEEEIDKDGYSDKVKVELNNEGLEISIQEVVIFNSGDAEVFENVSPLLLKVSKVLNGLDNNIKVVGHTDTIPIYNQKYRSNWDLSVMRAINVMTFLVEKGNLQPERFSVQGYGQYSPRYDNSTEEGRAKNRRVEIFLVRKYPLNSNNSSNSENSEKTAEANVKEK